MDKFDISKSRWTPIKRVPDKEGQKCWLMKCECGVEREVNWKNYLKGRSRSCGCYRRESAKNDIGGRQWRSLPLGEAARNSLMLTYRRGSVKRGFTFDLTVEQFTDLTSSNCHFCGRPPNRSHYPIAKGVNGPYPYNGIDRKDNLLGYTVENCVPACTECNRAKNTMGYEEFIFYLDTLSSFRRSL